jgi:hypothetical protein
MYYLHSVYFNNYPLHVSKRLAAHHQEVLLCIYSNRFMSCVYVDWLLVRSIRILPTAYCGSSPYTGCFSTRTRPHSVTFLAIDSVYFRAKPFAVSIPQHSQPQSFFVSTPLWRWTDRVLRKVCIKNLGPGELPRRNPTILLCYLQSVTYCHKLWTKTAFYYFFLHRDVF